MSAKAVLLDAGGVILDETEYERASAFILRAHLKPRSLLHRVTVSGSVKSYRCCSRSIPVRTIGQQDDAPIVSW